MTKTGWTVLIVVLVLAIGGGFAYAYMRPAAPAVAPDTTGTDGTALAPAGGAATVTTSTTTTTSRVTVTYTDSGFSPKTVNVKVGDTVTFVNNSTRALWTASDEHPTHTEYDGTSLSQHCAGGTDTKGGFDECSSVSAGGTYSFTFSKAGTFEYHNHLRASDTGTVVVK